MKNLSPSFVIVSIATLAVAHAAAPETQKFLDGSKIKFSTKGHAKAKGLQMTIYFPSSWSAREGERPNIVEKFVSDAGRGDASAMINAKSLPVPVGTKISKEDLAEFFTPGELKKLVPTGAKFVGAKSTKIEGLPAGILEYSMAQETAGIGVNGQFVAYIFIQGTTMVQLQCGVAGSENTSASQRMSDYKPLFTLMANSIVLEDKWK